MNTSATPDGDTAGDGVGDKAGVAARLTAWQIVHQVGQADAWASRVADRVLSTSRLTGEDRTFAANLAFSTLRWLGTLDWALAHQVSRGLDAVEAELLDVLRIGTWELLYGRQPVHAVVDSHVEVARAVVGARSTGFVNGVLRGLARNRDALPWPDPATPLGMGLAHAYPDWIAEQAVRRFGAARAPAVLAAGNTPAPLVLRTVAPREEVLALLAGQAIAAEPGSLASDAVVLSEVRDPSRLAVVRDGLATVQDQSSQYVGQVAAEGLPPGARAIDLCAAPGGKATHLAQQGLDVLAVDRHAGRLRRAAALADRLGLAIRTHVADGTDPGLPEGEADLILVDAPCTGLGVVRRRPELRWRRSREDLTTLPDLQRRLLRSAARLVRPGGRVVYSVCTWTGAEADEVVHQTVQTTDLALGALPDRGFRTECGTQLSSDADEGDGMFVAVLERAE